MQKYVNLEDLKHAEKKEYLVVKFGFDTAENEPSRVCCMVRIRESLGDPVLPALFTIL